MWTKENETPSQATNVDACVFVSYADEDRPAAERVVRALTSLNWRVWWDREIAPGKTFDERISERLRSAGAVVVLWSQHSVVSEWVREEASDAKRRDVLVPALIEHVEPPLGFKLRQAVDLTSWNGSPSAPEFSALAAAVRALITPLEAATPTPATGTAGHREGRKALPVVTLFARILAVLLAAGAASGLWFWDAYYRVQLEHFANVRTRYGLPEGFGRLDAAQVEHRNVSLAFMKRGRRNPVDEVRLVNSTGNTPAPTTYFPTSSVSDLNPLSSFDIDNPLASDLMTVTRVTFTRDATGGVLEQKGFTSAGRLAYTLHYASRDTAEYKTQGFTRQVRASGIAYLRFIRVESGPNAGLDEKVVFLDAAQQPQPTETGAYGYRNTFDERGLVHESFSLGPRLEDRPNNYGLFKGVASRSPLGDVTEEVHFDQKGARVPDRVGVALGRWQYDKEGNVTQLTLFDRNGELVMSGLAPARIDLAYDDRARLKTMTLFGPDQRPVLGPEGFARKTLEWLSPTRVLSRFFDPKGDPKAILGLAFEILDTFDERGLPIEETFRDSKGEPTRIQNGCSTVQLAHDADGNTAEYRCLNEQRNLTFSTDGWSIVRSTYDQRGNPVTTQLLDREGKPGNQKDFYTSIRREYSPFGKLSKETFLDSSGTGRKARSGYASVAYTYDHNGNRSAEAFFDEAGRPIAIAAGYAAIRSEFDGRGRETQTWFLSVQGHPVRLKEGYAAARHEYDERGFLNASTFLDENSHPVNSTDGYALVRRKHNADGKVLEIAYFDDRGKPIVSKRPGSGRRRWTYDALGNVIERSDCDTTGRPMMNAYGYSTVRYSHDAYGRETGRQLLDISRLPVTFKVIVDMITDGSVAADAGFRVGDAIMAYDGEPVDTLYEFTNRFELFKGDRRREIRVERGGQIVALDLPPGRITGFELQESAHR